MDKPELTYDKYGIHNVFGEKPTSLRAEIVEFWLRQGALQNEAAAWQRTKDVVLVVRNPESEVVGISTVYVADFRTRGNKYYFYRMFIGQGHRVPGMMRFVTLATLDVLKTRHKPGGPSGLLVVAENPKLTGPGVMRMAQRGGFTYAGKNQNGFDVWGFGF